MSEEFLLSSLALFAQGRGYNRFRNSQRAWLQPRVRHFLLVRCGRCVQSLLVAHSSL